MWKDEAFKTWVDTWALIYKATNKKGVEVPADEESISFLQSCHDTMYLVNIVDNNFIESNLEQIMTAFIEDNKELIQ